MTNQIKHTLLSLALVIIVLSGCKKGTFDINSPNPNVPSTVPVKFSLSSALKETADLMYAGNEDFLQYWMGYWSVSGDYIPNNSVVLYQLTTDYFSGNWDNAYLNLENYAVIASNTNVSNTYYTAIGKIMQAFVFQRVVDLYNNAPYDVALQGSANFFPVYSDAGTIYKSLIEKVDTAINLINTATAEAVTPGDDDVMFGGDMDLWIKFANTLKLKLLLRTTINPVTPIQAALSGLTEDDFLGTGEDGAVNPGYQNVAGQQNPQWADIGFVPGGQPAGNNTYYRANSYAVNFYQSTDDPRAFYFYNVNDDGDIKGRQFGSVSLEHNKGAGGISGVDGPGIIKSVTQDAIILPAFESLFLQAEAAQRGYISANAEDLYKAAVTESFSLLGAVKPPVKSVVDPSVDSITYTPEESASYYLDSSSNNKTNWNSASDKITLIITQKWAALNAFDPLESYSDWRRLKIPSNLPVSVYPGNTATHIPYRLLYATSEYNYNAANVNQEGTIDPLTSKIFWMP